MKKVYFTSLLIFFLPNIIFSQLQISGKILSNSKPAEFVNIIIKGSDATTIINKTITDSLGYFSIVVDKQSVKLQVSQFDEVFFEKQFDLVENTDLGIIEINNSRKLEEVVVSGKKPKIKKELGKFIVENISNSQFSKGKNTIEVLKYVPILNSTESGISIFNKGDASILINGKNMGSNEIALNILKSIPSSNIRKIEIISNPDSRYEANNKNGIINIILKNNDNEGLKGSLNSTISQSYFSSKKLDGFISYSKNNFTITSGSTIDNSKRFNRYYYQYNNINTNKQSQISSNSFTYNKGISFFINSDYKLNSKNTIGLQLSNVFSDKFSNTQTLNVFKSINSNVIDSNSVNNINRRTPNFNSFRGNINYSRDIDSLGTVIHIDHTIVNRKNNTSNYYDFVNSDSPDDIFIQNPNESFIINASKVDITKIIDENNKLLIGGNFIYSNIKNFFFQGNFDGVNYISDPLQTNDFRYRDYTSSIYLNYEKIINEKWQGKIGIRFENFYASGKTDNGTNQTSLKNTYFFPSLSLLFMLNENHEFSLDFGSYIFRPYYTQVNPFVKYTSSNSYTINNPNLLPSLSYELAFSYSFYNDFIFNIDYSYDKNLFNDFDIVLPNNFVQTTTANYGVSNSFHFGFIYSKSFFKEYWNFSALLNYMIDDSKGNYGVYNMDYKNSSYSINLKNQIRLSAKKDFYSSFIYKYHSSNSSVIGDMKALHSLVIELTKTVKNFNITLSADDLAMSDVMIRENKLSYSFYKKIDYFQTYSLSIRYNFGNKKVKKVSEKNNDINNRLL